MVQSNTLNVLGLLNYQMLKPATGHAHWHRLITTRATTMKVRKINQMNLFYETMKVVRAFWKLSDNRETY